MSTRRLDDPAPGESLVAIEPELLQQVADGWRHRLALYTGRALTESALTTEQDYRSGSLSLLSQLITPGTAEGLEATIDAGGQIRVSPGYGFTALGEDVTLTRELAANVKDLQVVDGITGQVIATHVPIGTDQPGGVYVLALQPVIGKATGEEIDSGGAPIEISGDLNASCAVDPEAFAFEDWESVDGARLVLAAWPDPADTLALPDADPAPTFRCRLAATIFASEMQLGRDGYLPWQGITVPLGVLDYDAAWKLSFVDRNMVVRSGGHARRTCLINPTPGQPVPFLGVSSQIADARLLQLLEQTAGVSDLSAFPILPPTGILPTTAIDLATFGEKRWFPASWRLQVGPIHAEEVETALRAQRMAAPLDLETAEDVQVLLPLTDDVYDPDVMVVEQLAQEFIDEQNKAIGARDAVLQHHKFLQSEANALLEVLAQETLDLDEDLSPDEKTGRDKAVYVPPADGSEAFGTQVVANVVVSADVQSLKSAAAAAPYTRPSPGSDATGKPLPTVPLFSAEDWAALDSNGLQHFIDRIDARISSVEDVLNLAFLQTQTDIYRHRTNVLSATDAARLVTSPIVANIAQRESAVATAQDLQAYIQSLSPNVKPTASPAAGPGARAPIAAVAAPASTAPSASLASKLRLSANTIRIASNPAVTQTLSATAQSSILLRAPAVDTSIPASFVSLPRPAQISQLPSQINLPQASDVVTQQPLIGAQFNVRTLNIAERLKQSPSLEALTYSLSNRTTFLDQMLATDLGINVDDLQVLVLEDSGDATKPFTQVFYPLGRLRLDPAFRAQKTAQIQKAGLVADADEPAVFSAGLSTLDHHTLLLRAVEGRLALYRQFLQMCSDALTTINGNASSVLAAIGKTNNDLSQARQNLSFVNAIISDENARIAAVNTQRAQLRANVPFIVYMRPRTLATDENLPSRQLVPANVANPVPAALASNATLPPELREITGLLREAPLAWIPSAQALLAELERRQHLYDLAVSMQARAFTRLQLPLVESSATEHPGPYGPPIANVFVTQQQTFIARTQDRANFRPAQLVELSWAAQQATLFSICAFNDLLAAEAVHLEIAHEIAQLIENVSKVATALYLRVSDTLPVRRLEWAEYLSGGGRTVLLRDLSTLPGWNTQDYIERQQMQALVDWLFGQIDSSIADANAYMSDLVRTAILLASHAPVNDVIASEVAMRIKPALGGIVPLRLPSGRVGRGMPVLLYQAGNLTARAVVDDLDQRQVYAKVTAIYQPDVTIEESAQAHFLNEDPQAAVVSRFTLGRT